MTAAITPGREELLALREIAAFNITPSTGASVAMRMRDIACNAINAATARLAAKPVSSSVQLSELDAASNACLELCSRHGFATGHGDTVADIIREIDAQITGRLAAKPAEEGVVLLRRCADIALAIDSGRGNEKEIAKAILALSPTGAPKP